MCKLSLGRKFIEHMQKYVYSVYLFMGVSISVLQDNMSFKMMRNVEWMIRSARLNSSYFLCYGHQKEIMGSWWESLVNVSTVRKTKKSECTRTYNSLSITFSSSFFSSRWDLRTEKKNWRYIGDDPSVIIGTLHYLVSSQRQISCNTSATLPQKCW